MRQSIHARVLTYGCWTFLCLMSLLAPAGVAQNLPARKLNPRWEAKLGVPASEGFYRMAVCDNGRAYLSDGLGRIAVLDDQGAVLSDSVGHPTSGTVAIACDAKGRLLAASVGKLLTLEATGAKPRMVSELATQGTPLPHRVLSTPDATFVTAEKSGKFVHKLDIAGSAVKSFADAPQQESPSQSRIAGERGCVLWDRRQKRVLYIPMSPFEIQVFDANGNLVGHKGSLDPDFHPMSSVAGRSSPANSDQVVFAAFLPDGQLVAQTIKGRTNKNGIYERKSQLVILDSTYNVTGTVPLPPAFGVLQGVSGDGTLFFVRVDAGYEIEVRGAALITN